MSIARRLHLPSRQRAAAVWHVYWRATQEPLYSLLFLFPLVGVYEFGALMLRTLIGDGEQLVAHGLIFGFLSLFGAQAAWLPGAALVLTLLVWHWLARRPWQIHGWVLPAMLMESLTTAVPLLILTRLPQAAWGGADLPRDVVLSIGAGLYEELVFRVYIIVGLHALLADVLHVRRRVSLVVSVAAAALLFAACHFRPIGVEVFGLGSFTARAVAGVYLSLVFLGRGLGVAVGCHATHNLVVLLTRAAGT